jgi:nucleoside recognition membrane protein YjiH
MKGEGKMEKTTVAVNQSKSIRQDIKSVTKFVICSLIGIFLFFINVPIKGGSQLPIDVIVSLFTGVLAPYYTYVLMACTVIYCVNMVRTKGWKGTRAEMVIFFFSILGGIMIFMRYFRVGPAFLFAPDVIPAAVDNMGKAFVMVFIVAFFLPLLLDFGLVDFVGVISRPLMRLIFKLPGRTAVVAIGAFLGNFTVGHITSNALYTSGRVTTREAAIINTNLSTTSIALMLFFANSTGQVGRWGEVFLVCAFTVYLVTAIVVRLNPLRKLADDYYVDATPDPEVAVKTQLLPEAWKTGIQVAEKAANPLKAIWMSGSKSFIMIACIHVSAVSLWVLPALVNKYTPIFSWLGSLFKPIFLLFGMPNAEELSQAVGLSFVNPIAATVGLGGMNLAPAAMFFAATFAIPIVIFFGAFLASMYSTKIPVKLSHVFILWFERAILTVLILCVVCKVMF